mmetsp:Transcript_15060/g.30515  ORF Transcript_15060/g.30515 Transcript_15060/m.30515 type:complete len:82 (+) Transcript_15060:636-881(+)
MSTQSSSWHTNVLLSLDLPRVPPSCSSNILNWEKERTETLQPSCTILYFAQIGEVEREKKIKHEKSLWKCASKNLERGIAR